MKNARLKGRILFRRPPRGVLPHLLITALSPLLALPAFLTASCDRADAGETHEEKTPVDSINTVITLIAEHPIRNADIFIFEDSGLMPLEGHISMDGPETEYRGPIGKKRIVAVANCPYGFNLTALQRYDAMEKMEFLYPDDDPGLPLMTGEMSLEAGCDGNISMIPLMSRIQILSISNGMDGYRRLEEPRIMLRDAAMKAVLLKEKGFSPTEYLTDTMGLRGRIWEKLPYDIGMYPQTPGTALWCYPNENGTVRTSLIFECEIKGETVQYRTELPPVGRNRTVSLELEVTEKDKYSWKIY